MALGITAVVSVMVVNLFLVNLRAVAKNKALTEVKQNGDYALAVMERFIRNSQEVISCTGNSITIKNVDGEITTFQLDGDQVASNTAHLTSSKLRVKGGIFSLTCNPATETPRVVTISFTLEQPTTSLGQEFRAEAPFQLKVSARNY